MIRVLLVEDDPMESKMYKTLFEKEGFEVFAIENGTNCRTAAIDFKPNIVLLDCMMPQMNGFEALDVLRFDEETKKIPVIMLTNLSDKHYEEEARSRGAVEFIIKSQIENNKLIAKVKDIVGAYTS